MRIGIAHHYGWAVAVTATEDHRVVDRRRIALVEPGVPAAPIHHEGGAHALHRSGARLDDVALDELVTEVRASVTRAAGEELDELSAALGGQVASLAVRGWPLDFPLDVAIQRRAPYESRADSIMYCQLLAELADRRGWEVRTYDARTVERDASERLGDQAREVLHGPRDALGPPWSKDHRVALAATIVAT